MDRKQFEILQEAVQWVVDEAAYQHRTNQGDWHPATYERPHEWNQNTWGIGSVRPETDQVMVRGVPYLPVCASACCLAGHIVVAAGEKMVLADPLGLMHGVKQHVTACLTCDGHIELISDRARDLAGLDDGEAMVLFDSGMDADAIVAYADGVCRLNGYELEVV